MKLFTKSLLLAVLLPLLAHAQGNFKPGYVVTLNNDTLRGVISLRDWNQNPDHIDFKSGEALSRYTPKDLKAFAITNIDQYQTALVSISQNDLTESHLTEHPDSTFTTATVFLHLLASGRYVELLSYSDKLKERFYILDKRSPTPIELNYRPYYYFDDQSQFYYVDNGKKKINDNRIYRRQLFALADYYQHRSNPVVELINQSLYAKSDLIKIINLINEEAGTNKVVATSKSGISFFAGVAAVQSKLNFTGKTALANAQSTTYTSPKFLIGMDLIANRDVDRFVIRGQLDFNVTDLQAKGPEESETARQVNIAFTPQLVYNVFNTNAMKVFIASGFSAILSSYPKDSHFIQYTTFVSYTEENKLAFSRIRFTVPFKAGIRVANTVEFNATYFLPCSVTDYLGFHGRESVMDAGVSYIFGNKRKSFNQP